MRHDLLRALSAAFGLDADMDVGLTRRQQCALQVLDEISLQHDPASDWPTFFETLFETLWSRRHDIRADLHRSLGRHIGLSPGAKGFVTSGGPQGRFPHEAHQTVRALR